MSSGLKTVGAQFGLGGGGATGDAMKAGLKGNANASAINTQALNTSQTAYNPYIQLGTQTTNAMSDQLGLNGVGAQQTAFNNYAMSPGQAFLQQQGEKALLRNSAATGTLGSGGTRAALQDRAQQFAMTDYGNYWNRMAGQQGLGVNSLDNMERLRAGYSGVSSNLANERGEIRGSGIMGIANQKSEGLQNLVKTGAMMYGMASDRRLKDNITHIGTLESGTKLYSWTWNDIANSMGLHGSQEGVIAQEVMHIPDAVILDDTGYYKVNYSKVH